MKVIVQNQVPTYQATCVECGSVFQYTRHDTLPSIPFGREVYCPVCKSFTPISMRKKYRVDIEPPTGEDKK